jgi:hypothetical protein
MLVVNDVWASALLAISMAAIKVKIFFMIRFWVDVDF